MKNLLVINGPNINILGSREKDVYGTVTLNQIEKELQAIADKEKVAIDFFQSNSEGEIVSKIQKAPGENVGVIIINPAAYTHTSIAIRDAIAAIDIPTIEVHISNIYSREEFRHVSHIAPVARGQISGFGAKSYVLAYQAAKDLL